MCGVCKEIAVIALSPECGILQRNIRYYLSPECVVFYKEIVVIAQSNNNYFFVKYQTFRRWSNINYFFVKYHTFRRQSNNSYIFVKLLLPYLLNVWYFTKK
jgi:hypothetical protein